MATAKNNQAPFKYTKVQSVSLPDWAMIDNERPYYFRVTGPLVQGKPVENKQTGIMESAPTKCRAVNLEDLSMGDPDTGEVSLLVPAMVRNSLEVMYPGERYVGRCFQVIMHAEDRAKKKRYRTATITEIEPETGGETEVAG